jgi:hypothetical protein
LLLIKKGIAADANDTAACDLGHSVWRLYRNSEEIPRNGGTFVDLPGEQAPVCRPYGRPAVGRLADGPLRTAEYRR